MLKSFIGYLCALATVFAITITNTVQAQDVQVNGLNVKAVEYSKMDQRIGYFTELSEKTWTQVTPQSMTSDGSWSAETSTATWVETGRDEWSVYLISQSGDVSVQIDLWTKKVKQAGEEIGKVSSSSATPKALELAPIPVNGQNVTEVAFGSAGVVQGSFVQTGEKSWNRLAADGSVVSSFTEIGRDEWSVYLAGDAGNVVLNLWTKVVKQGSETLGSVVKATSEPVKAPVPPPAPAVAQGTIVITEQPRSVPEPCPEGQQRVGDACVIVADVVTPVPEATPTPAPSTPPIGGQIITSTMANTTEPPKSPVIEDWVLEKPEFEHLRFQLLCNSDPGNPMLDGWGTPFRPLLQDAARQLLARQGKPTDSDTIEQLVGELWNNPIRRWEFAPFMLRVLWEALVAPNPTAAQSYFRDQFEKWAACDETKTARMTLALWNSHIGKANSIDGQFWFGSVPAYKPNTLSVLVDTKSGGSFEGFLPLENPLFLGTKGQDAVRMLYKPMTAYSIPEFDDTENLRPLGGAMSETALNVGFTVAGIGAITAASGAVVVSAAVSRSARQISAAARLAEKRGAGLVAQWVGEKIASGASPEAAAAEAVARFGSEFGDDVAKKVAESSGQTVGKLTAERLKKQLLGDTMKKALEEAAKKAAAKAGQEAGQEAAELTGKELAKAMGRIIGEKVVMVGAVVGVLATMGEILGKVVADAVQTQEYDASLNRSANTVTPFHVAEFLGSNPDESKRTAVFTQLVKMTIADPADLDLLTLDLPAAPCRQGMMNDGGRGCIPQVYYQAQPSLSLPEAQAIAKQNDWELATSSEVLDAWMFGGFQAFAYGRMADGRFAVPVQTDYPNFPAGANIGASGGNQGFFYVLADARLGNTYDRASTPIECQPGSEAKDGLCYASCQAGYSGFVTTCTQNCPAGFREDGLYCAKPAAYERPGFPWQAGDPPLPNYSGPTSRCEAQFGGPGTCEQAGAIIYPKCRANFHAATVNLCSPDCPAGMTDIGVSCQKKTYDRGVGRQADYCQPGTEPFGLACYATCRKGFRTEGASCYRE